MTTPLKTKTQNALDEGRTLILGAQILLGALYRAAFEPGFDKFSSTSQYLVLFSLVLILISTTILIMPAPYHRIVEEGRDTREFNHFVYRVMYAGLLPFALSFAVAVYVSVKIISGTWISVLSGVGTAVLALFFWYGLKLVSLRRRRA